jgi:predicted secreted protein
MTTRGGGGERDIYCPHGRKCSSSRLAGVRRRTRKLALDDETPPRLRIAAAVAIILLILWSLPGCGFRRPAPGGHGTTVMEPLDESANGREIHLRRGETFEVRLHERPTTGFRWRLMSDGAPACVLVGDAFEAPTSSAPGSPGQHSWRFRVERAGQAIIELAALRPWDQDASPARVFRLTVTVAD